MKKNDRKYNYLNYEPNFNMKICFISEAKSVHTQKWTRGLSNIGCEVSLISSNYSEIPNVKIFSLPLSSCNPILQLIYLYNIKKVINSLKPDIVHLFGLFSLFSFGSMWISKILKKFVVSVWGSDIIASENKTKFKDNFIKKRLLKDADLILATSNYLANETERYIKSSKKIHIIHWGVDLTFFKPKLETNNSETIVLGFAKKLRNVAGPDVLLKALKYAQKKNKDKIKLIIAGDGPMENELKKEASANGLADQIEWLGWLDKPEKMKEFYNSIDLLVMPSRRESYGVVAVEAAASGLPVVASNFGGIPEIVVHGETGLLVSPENSDEFGEAILNFAKNPKLRFEMGRNARLRAEDKFNWDNSLSKMIELCNQIIVGG